MYVYGKNPVRDLYKKDLKSIKKVYIERKRHQAFYELLRKGGIEMFDIKKLNLRDAGLTEKNNTQGIIALIDEPKIYTLRELLEKHKHIQRQIYLVLDQIEDPQNFGAILRSAAAFSANGVIYPSRNSAKLNSTSMKTSAGNWMNIDLCETSSLNQTIRALKDEGVWIVSTSLDAESNLTTLSDLNQPMAIILGNEGKGIRPSLIEKSEINIKINMNSKVESLNVSTTAAIILHELYKDVKK